MREAFGEKYLVCTLKSIENKNKNIFLQVHRSLLHTYYPSLSPTAYSSCRLPQRVKIHHAFRKMHHKFGKMENGWINLAINAAGLIN
mmetsp:Transcript_4501/g.8659  ORF Transcript_4501/g.8659 Transcript_4501/m.8659 type:complete len:87 (+) Transcript_4501:1922-2182(+)